MAMLARREAFETLMRNVKLLLSESLLSIGTMETKKKVTSLVLLFANFVLPCSCAMHGGAFRFFAFSLASLSLATSMSASIFSSCFFLFQLIEIFK